MTHHQKRPISRFAYESCVYIEESNRPVRMAELISNIPNNLGPANVKKRLDIAIDNRLMFIYSGNDIHSYAYQVVDDWGQIFDDNHFLFASKKKVLNLKPGAIVNSVFDLAQALA